MTMRMRTIGRTMRQDTEDEDEDEEWRCQSGRAEFMGTSLVKPGCFGL